MFKKQSKICMNKYFNIFFILVLACKRHVKCKRSSGIRFYLRVPQMEKLKTFELKKGEKVSNL